MRLEIFHKGKCYTPKSVVQKITGIDDWSYFDMMHRIGELFAMKFCQQFSDPEYEFKMLSQGDTSETRTYFWGWWRLKWSMDDKLWFDGLFYKQQLSYEEFKQHMVTDEMLHKELFEDLSKKESV